MIEIDVRGMREVQRVLDGLSQDQVPYALSLALNNTAFAVRSVSKQRLETAFDRPTRFIVSATRVEKATKQTLVSRVFIDPKRAAIIRAHEQGGSRGAQEIERFLISKGWLPSGWRAFAGAEFPRDQYGNPKRSDVKRVIAELSVGISGIAGSIRRCFVIRPGQSSHLHPGIYRLRSRSDGRALMPLFLFASRAEYRATLRWLATVEAEARRVLPDQAVKAVQRAMATAR